MTCEFCNGVGVVPRVKTISHDGWNVAQVETVTCPCCIRGITVLGTHEMLRDARGNIHGPGSRLTVDREGFNDAS
ncbi:hypothetical protein MHAEM_21151 [Mycolicibacterium phlei]|nr:hypothetical protein [Mycolicibacterium phlei]